jgi:soluble lytic murein transglycosylase
MIAKKHFSLPVLIVLMVALICAAMITYLSWRENRFNGIIDAASRRHGLDYYLVKALVKRESNFKPRARGRKGEIGLMQVTPRVVHEYAFFKGSRDFKPEALDDPSRNTEVGCWYLARAMKRYRDFPDPVPFALAHYNAGATNVDRWIKQTRNRGDAREFMAAITYPGTRNYVKYIMRRWRRYRWFV